MNGRTRGRPRTRDPRRSRRDRGTPELAAKRALGMTGEVLDLCLARGVLTQEQHWCGVHLRWLYTLRFGAPGVRAVDPTHLGGADLCEERPEWRAAREAEYHAALRVLGARASRRLLGLAVLGDPPICLFPPTAGMDMRTAAAWSARAGAERAALEEAFDRLVRLWCRKSVGS